MNELMGSVFLGYNATKLISHDLTFGHSLTVSACLELLISCFNKVPFIVLDSLFLETAMDMKKTFLCMIDEFKYLHSTKRCILGCIQIKSI